MTQSNWLSIFGLISDVTGTLILFKYGLPSKINNHNLEDLYPKEEIDRFKRLMNLLKVNMPQPRINPLVESANRKIYDKAMLGLILVIMGFTLQLLANFFPFTATNPSSQKPNKEYDCCCHKNK